MNAFITIMHGIKEAYPHLSFGFHHLQTAHKNWDSVVAYDRFFEDVSPVTDLGTFKKLITADEQVTALDIANLITSKVEITHLKLQKLLFFFYREFKRQHNKLPFKEDFLAWDYGPVIREVYDKYRTNGRGLISESGLELKEDDTQIIYKEDPFKLSVYSRFMKTPNFGDILVSLESTLKEYGDLSASDLVELTHQDGSPWSQVYRNGFGKNQIIDQSIIH